MNFIMFAFDPIKSKRNPLYFSASGAPHRGARLIAGCELRI